MLIFGIFPLYIYFYISKQNMLSQLDEHWTIQSVRREKAANERIVGVEGRRNLVSLARYYKCKICKSTTKSKVLIVRHVLRAHADKVQEARGDRERAKVIIREAIEVEDKWSCNICQFPGCISLYCI